MLISPAYAQAAGGADGGILVSLMPLILIFVVFYFLLIRPQQKKVKQHKELLSNLRRGDRIVTGGGIIGRIARVEGDTELLVEIAPEVKVRIMRSTVSDRVSSGEPAAGEEVEKQKEKIATERRIAKKDYYSILGIRRTTSGERISKAYRKLAEQYHPDTNPNDPQAKAKFEEIKEAYDTLKDPKLRRIYDSIGHDEYVKIQKN